MARKKAVKTASPAAEPKPKKLTQASVLREKEKHIQERVRDFLCFRRWRAFRNNPTVAMASSGNVFRSGEKGMPDHTFVYYFGTRQKPSPLTLTLYIEFKREGKEPKPDQIKWHDKERTLGAYILVINNSEEFEREYYRVFGWLHAGPKLRGQAELFLASAACLPPELLPAL